MSISWQEDRKKNKQASASRAGSKFWEEEKDNFGTKMLQKMGWEQGKGLGKTESGITSHLRARKKNDSLGIGADKKVDHSWMAMASMYNDLLKKLNTAQVMGDQAADPVASEETPAPKTAAPTVKAYIARTQLYSRFKKSKDVSSYSKEAMAEILGRKSPTTVTELPPEPPPAAADTPAEPAVTTDSLLTTTSSLSIKDYFAKKLAANKASSRFQVAGGSGFTLDQQAKNYEHMLERSQTSRGGLGFGAPASPPTPAPGPRRSPRLKAMEVHAAPAPPALELSAPAEEDEAEAKKRRKAEKRARKEQLQQQQQEEETVAEPEEPVVQPKKKRKVVEAESAPAPEEAEETVDPAEAKRLRKEARAAARAEAARVAEEEANAAAEAEAKAAAKAARRAARKTAATEAQE